MIIFLSFRLLSQQFQLSLVTQDSELRYYFFSNIDMFGWVKNIFLLARRRAEDGFKLLFSKILLIH